MQTSIALFRGINVGGKNKVIMKDLVALMQDKGFSNVQTYIQSGNVVFQCSEDNHSDISSLVEAHFGFKPAVLLLSPSDLKRAIEGNPFAASEGKACHFYFCDDVITDFNAEKLASLKMQTEDYAVIGKVFYLYAPDGVGRSKLAASIETCVGLPLTARNLNTVLKLAQMVES